MRHPGIDIARITDDAIAVGTDALKGASWLTALDKNSHRRSAGSRSCKELSLGKLKSSNCLAERYIQAGSAPAIGDINKGDRLPLYQMVFKLLAPFVEIAAKRSPR